MSFTNPQPVGFTDFFLSGECSYVLRKIYELEDVRYELEKQYIVTHLWNGVPY